MTKSVNNNYKNQAMIAWASREGDFIHIADAEKGQACQCVCLDCGSDLVARQGEGYAYVIATLKSNPNSKLKCLILPSYILTNLDRQASKFNFLNGFEGILFFYSGLIKDKSAFLNLTEFIMPERWTERLISIAKDEALKKAKAQESKNSQFKQYFNQLPNDKKIAYLSNGNEFTLQPDPYLDRYNKNWNTTNRIWKFAVLKYVATPVYMEKRGIDSCVISDVADNSFLLNLFNISLKADSKFRSIDTYRLFQDLAKQGYFQKGYGLQFFSCRNN